MLKQQGWKFRLKPTCAQRQALARTAGCRRFVWNRGLEIQKKLIEQGQRILSYPDLCKLLTGWKQDSATSWLAEPPSQALQQSLKDLSRACQDGLHSHKGMPHFKAKWRDDGFRCPQGVLVEDNRVRLPKIGWVAFYKSREIVGVIKNTHVTFDGEHWYVAFQTEHEVLDPQHTSMRELAIDMGVKILAMFSDGQSKEPIRIWQQLRGRLRVEQRRLSRMQKGSANYKKQRGRLSRLWRRIRNFRQDYLHKLTTEISKNHAVVYLEDLKVAEMTRSARGTQDKPGKNVKQKAALNQSILEQGWYEFKRQLKYKLEWLGGELILVDPAYTSQCCSECGHTDRKNRPKRDCFVCVACGYREHADLVAAKNIMAVGHTVTACGAKGLKRAFAQESPSL